MLQLSVRKPDVQQAIQDLRVSTEEKIRLVMEAVGAETIAYLKEFTDQRRPPVRKGGPERIARRGGWADITGQLANSYGWSVSKVQGGHRLTLSNSAEYAIYLEHRDGFFVLSGVTEPGGPVEAALVEVCARIAPEFKVVHATAAGLT